MVSHLSDDMQKSDKTDEAQTEHNDNNLQRDRVYGMCYECGMSYRWDLDTG